MKSAACRLCFPCREILLAVLLACTLAAPKAAATLLQGQDDSWDFSRCMSKSCARKKLVSGQMMDKKVSAGGNALGGQKPQNQMHVLSKCQCRWDEECQPLQRSSKCLLGAPLGFPIEAQELIPWCALVRLVLPGIEQARRHRAIIAL
jgi:hypothetical protein